MRFLRRYRWPLIGFGVVLAVVSFLAFRPDKIFIDDAVDESLSEAFVASTTTTTTRPPDSEAAPTTTTTASAPTPDPNEPAVIASGMFYGIDHSAAGTATIYEQDGSYVLRFEDNTDIQNGPDLYVWVLAEPDFDGSEPSDFIDLGLIKGNVGGQNYQLPPEFDPAIHRSVLIWCLRFSIPFAAAPLA
ncbi:MAG: DM13 domain-containing protein [Acidimicrobiia bacterium]